MEVTFRAKLAQLATKPRKHTQKGDLQHLQFSNINLFVDVSDADNNAAICQMHQEGLEGDYLLVTISTLQEQVPFGDTSDAEAETDDDDLPLLEDE